MDLGSGYGAMVLYTAAVTQARATGVEILPFRHEIAVKSSKDLGLADKTRFLKSDLLNLPDAALENANVFFLFTPCKSGTLVSVVDKLRRRAQKGPIRIVSMGNSNHFLASQASGRGVWLRLDQLIRSTQHPDDVEGMSLLFSSIL